MLYTVETILNNINAKNREYYIQPYYVQKMLKDTIKEGGKLKKQLTTYSNIDFTNNREVIGFINKTLLGREAIKGKTISNIVLEELFVDTRNPFFQTLINYRRANDKYKKVCTFIKNVINSGFNKDDKDSVKEFFYKEFDKTFPIKPETKVNASGGITISNPSLQFSIEDIKHILGCDVAISFHSMEELLFFLDKYSDLIIHSSDYYLYLVIGTTLYAKMITDEFDAMPFEPEDYYELIREFQREYMGKDEPKQEESIFAKQAKHAE